MSQLKVDAIHSEDGGNSNIELDDSRNTTCKGNLTVDGTTTLTGAVTLPAGTTSDTLSFRNLMINGAMQVNQRGTVANAGNQYGGPDRMFFFKNDGAMTVSQDTDVPTGQGFANSWKCDVTSVAGTAGNNYVGLQQKIEGQNLQHVKKGTSNAEQLTLSFWIKSTKTGTYIAELWDEDNSRTCSKSYTVSTTNTWEKKTITFPADTTGALGNDNGDSFRVYLWFFAASGFSSGTLNTTWAANTNANRAVGQVNACDNTSNNIYITGLQLEIGSTATDFEHRPYQDELLKCWRYFYLQRSNCLNTGRGTGASNCNFTIITPVNMRTTPSISLTASSGMRHYGIDSHSDSTTAPTVVAWRDTSNHILCDQAGHSGVNDDRVLTLMPNGSASEGIELNSEL